MLVQEGHGWGVMARRKPEQLSTVVQLDIKTIAMVFTLAHHQHFCPYSPIRSIRSEAYNTTSGLQTAMQIGTNSSVLRCRQKWWSSMLTGDRHCVSVLAVAMGHVPTRLNPQIVKDPYRHPRL